MMQTIFKSSYSSALNSYNSLSSSKNIIGQVVVSEKNFLRLDIGDSRGLDLVLKDGVEADEKSFVSIDRKDIISMKSIKLEKKMDSDKGTVQKYTETLKLYGISPTNENLSMLESMHANGVDLTEQNILSYMISKESLSSILSGLDYQTAIALAETDLDLENDTVQKVAEKIAEIKSEKDCLDSKSSLKDSLSTEDAEKIAEEIYGSKMGKDIVDIIKTLHSENISINKKNIEKLNELFYKLDKLKDAEDRVFLETAKNNLDMSIENLYKIKFYESGSKVATSKEMENLEAAGFKVYAENIASEREEYLKDAKRVERDIRAFIEELEIDYSLENRNTVLEFLKNRIALNSENLETLSQLKEALSDVIENIDSISASKLIGKNIDLEKIDINSVREKLESLKSESVVDDFKKLNSSKILDMIASENDFKIDDISDISIAAKDRVLFESLPKSYSDSLNTIETAHFAFKKIHELKPYMILSEAKENSTVTLSSIISNRDSFDAVESKTGYSDSLDNIKALRLCEEYSYIRENLTSKMVFRAAKEKISLENIDLLKASEYIMKYKKQMESYEARKSEYVKTADYVLSSLGKKSETAVMMLLKMQKPVNIVEIKSLQDALENQDQLGHKLSDIIKDKNAVGKDIDSKLIDAFKRNVEKLTKSLSGSKADIESCLEEIESSVRQANETLVSHKEQPNELKLKLNEIMEKIEENKNASANNRVVQLPIYINGQFSNLNMYFKDKKSEAISSDDDFFSAVISVETKNIGDLNIVLKIKDKSLDIKIGLSKLEFKPLIESGSQALKDAFQSEGYDFGQLEFYEEIKDNAYDPELVLDAKLFNQKEAIDLII